MTNLLIDIAKEDPKAYCVSPTTIQTAIDRGASKEDICVDLIEIISGATDIYLEDTTCCAFVAWDYKKTVKE